METADVPYVSAISTLPGSDVIIIDSNEETSNETGVCKSFDIIRAICSSRC